MRLACFLPFLFLFAAAGAPGQQPAPDPATLTVRSNLVLVPAWFALARLLSIPGAAGTWLAIFMLTLVFAGDVGAILDLKRTRNAVVLAHNYQTPEIFHCVADIVGDSLALAREAMKVDAEVIVLAGVHFMA